MRITILEPYFTGSHAAWAEQYAAASRHRVELMTLPGRNWKWRMRSDAFSGELTAKLKRLTEIYGRA